MDKPGQSERHPGARISNALLLNETVNTAFPIRDPLDLIGGIAGGIAAKKRRKIYFNSLFSFFLVSFRLLRGLFEFFSFEEGVEDLDDLFALWVRKFFDLAESSP